MTARSLLRSLALAVTLLCSSIAHAQLFRAYLAVDGNDANPCTLPAPCRLLPAALAAVASGGEIWMLDSANYNTATVVINKSVRILAVPGAVGSVLAIGGPAINIATAGVDVSLRNLVIAPLPGSGGTNGVQMTAGNSLTVEGSFLSGLTGTGIFVSGAGLKVVDTTIRVIGSGHGISIWNGARATVTRAVISSNTQSAIRVEANAADTTTTASISGSTLEGSYAGLWAQSLHATAVLKVAVTGCQVDRTSIGLHAESSAGAPVTLAASNNLVTNTTVWGIYVNGTGATAWATGNTVTDNVYGFVAVTNGAFESAGNNALRNNGTDQFGTVTVVPMK